MHLRGRKQDDYGRFLSWEYVNLNEEIDEEVEFPFEDASPNFPIGSSSRVGSLDTSGLHFFAEILANSLDSFGQNPPSF